MTETDAPQQRKTMVRVHGPGPDDATLIPIDTLPAAHPDITVTPWGPAAADDWAAPHLRFSVAWDASNAGRSVSDITADACALAARLLTEAGHTGAATLHTLPIVDLRFAYLARPLEPDAQPQ